ncbi:cytochrome c oxidase assembly protein [Streptomyces sp. NPDC058701]|uniref:cytochrome c oxidase assembly protein n=1 Tax=Streptomyces sp. NPDC058701 TaxID=3346608 RepID=UPI003649021A
MIFAHVHSGPAPGRGLTELIAVVAAVLVTVAYLGAARRLRRRGDAWPWWRDAVFCAGGFAVVWATVGPLPGRPFTTHMVQHVIVGMAVPFLLVLARPFTLALRALAPGPARRGVIAFARSRPVAWLVFPPLAALVDVGGLWVLYRTPLIAAVRHEPWLHALVNAHVLAAGLLFTAAICQLDPVNHRWNVAVRGATLLAAGAAHGVLAKTLYSVPPPGTAFAPADLRAGAQVMYYGGDLLEAALATVVAAVWYGAGGRTQQRRLRRPDGGREPCALTPATGRKAHPSGQVT